VRMRPALIISRALRPATRARRRRCDRATGPRSSRGASAASRCKQRLGRPGLQEPRSTAPPPRVRRVRAPDPRSLSP
jgi:hypothetical protein